MTYKIKRRDWKGTYHLSDVLGWRLVGSEDDIDTCDDGYALVFANESKFDLSGQEAYDILEDLSENDESSGYTFDEHDSEVIIKIGDK